VKPTYFPQAADFRRWLGQHHADTPELWIGFFKKSSGKVAMTYIEAVEEALCHGWIDGIIKRVDADSYMHRFTPRQPRSIWSNVNVARVEKLIAAGRMHPAGLAAYAARDPTRTGVYTFETKQPAALPAAATRRFKSHRQAWRFFTAQAPSYQRNIVRWVMSAKQAATRERRLDKAIAASAGGRRLV
jgi:uncharacterized protein YdeI (YjbR/CyaY-like superfamily)